MFIVLCDLLCRKGLSSVQEVQGTIARGMSLSSQEGLRPRMGIQGEA